MFFSIIMPAYNAQSTIENSILSVLNQTHQQFELIIINDNSSDGTITIIERFLRDARVKLINNTSNLGVALSRNKGIEDATGEIISFLDSDDLWYPEKLAEQDKCFEKGCKVVCTDYDVIDMEGNIVASRTSPKEISYSNMLKSNFIGNLTGAYLTSFYGKHFQRNIGHEDYIMWLELVKKAPAFCINKKLAAYRLSNNSLSRNKLKALVWQWKIYRDILNMNYPKAIYYFINYAFYAVKKRS